MADFKRQHTVPKSYLKRFTEKHFSGSGNSKLAQYTKGENSLAWVDPKNATTAKYIYSAHASDGDYNHWFEKALAKIESNAIPLFDRIEARQHIDQSEREALSLFIAAMIRRPRHLIENFESQLQALAEGRAAPLSIIERDRNAFIERFGEDEVAEVEASIKRGEYKAPPGTGKHGLFSFWNKAIPRYAFYVQNMRWTLLRAPERQFFVASDAPVYIRRLARTNDPGMVGISRPDAEVTMPLSSRSLLRLRQDEDGQKDTIPMERASQTTVWTINKITVRMANRFVYAKQDSPLVRKLVRECKLRTCPE